MPDFFTLISLVIGVSGGTFAAIAAVHHVLSERVLSWIEQRDKCFEEIQAYGTPNTKQNGTKHLGVFDRSRNVWRFANLVPAFGLTLVSYAASADVCLRYWALLSDGNSTNGAADAAGVANAAGLSAGPWYMVVLAASIAVNIGAFIAMVFAWRWMRQSIEHLTTWKEEAGENEKKAKENEENGSNASANDPVQVGSPVPRKEPDKPHVPVKGAQNPANDQATAGGRTSTGQGPC